MIEGDGQEKAGKSEKDQAPGESHLASGSLLDEASHRDQDTVSEDHRQTVYSVPYSYEERLVVIIKFDHVVAVGRDVMGRAREAHQEEEEHDAFEPP